MPKLIITLGWFFKKKMVLFFVFFLNLFFIQFNFFLQIGNNFHFFHLLAQFIACTDQAEPGIVHFWHSEQLPQFVCVRL